MRLSDYDRDDPPISTHKMESYRYDGIAAWRLVVVVWLKHVTVGTFGSVWSDGPIVGVLLVIAFLWFAVPLLKGLEHITVRLRHGEVAET